MDAGQVGYEAYAKSTGGKTYDGRPMPTWEQVCERTPHVAKAWNDAAAALWMPPIAGTTGLPFEDALRAAKAGARIARAGWNGKGMWVAMTPGTDIAPHEARNGAALHIASAMNDDEHEEGFIRILPHLDMKAADGSLVIGWLASQTDLLANDWTVLP